MLKLKYRREMEFVNVKSFKTIGFDILVLAIITLISVTQTVYAADKKIVADGIEISSSAYYSKDKLMLPVRGVAEALGYEIKWIDEEKSCLVGSEEIPSIKFYTGKDMYIHSADAISMLGSVPEIKDERSYVSADFFRQFFSLDIKEEDGAVNINSKETELIENEAVKVKSGTIFTVSLIQNVSTGFSWTVEKDDCIRDMFSKSVPVEDKMMIGGSSIKIWKFRCDEPGEYTIKFTYERVFQENSAIKTSEYKVVVE